MSRADRKRENEAARVWKGGYRPYDLVKEASIAFGAVLLLAVVLTVLFSSPDDPPSTVKQWSRTDPVDFVTTAVSQLDGTSGTATYGPPYNHNSDGQHIAFLRPQKWLGVSHPIDAPQDFVLAPLHSITGQPALTAALAVYQAAPSKLQTAWTTNYTNALAKAKPGPGDSVIIPAGRYGPVPIMMNALLSFAQGGGLDGTLLTNRQFYQTDYTKPLMLMADGSVLANRAQAEHLLGEQWGMMNETGSYPGQVWLWLYTFWYQIKPFSTSNNADILVMAIMGVLSLAFVLVPFLPVINRIPRWIPIYKLIWREHYASLSPKPSPAQPMPPPAVNAPG
ncbi:MAG TPA: hypothetical protein VFN87_02035 [Solirubrobacteraceae bacterium]|nr:hypothetical protein [Solirubrobacteraceae bacterium]